MQVMYDRSSTAYRQFMNRMIAKLNNCNAVLKWRFYTGTTISRESTDNAILATQNTALLEPQSMLIG